MMKNAKFIPLVAILMLSLVSCYNPLLPDNPFLCGEGGKCPDGYNCYGGMCLTASPECMDRTHPDYDDWGSDQDMEPNNHPDLAVTLPCADDGVFTDPLGYQARCPNRENYTNGFMNLMICPREDKDFYKVYLMPNEAVTFKIVHAYDVDPPRDLDGKVWRWDFQTEAWVDDVAVGLSTNDLEEISFNTNEGSNNFQGWYYLEVFGKGPQDINHYTVSFTLNASPMAN